MRDCLNVGEVLPGSFGNFVKVYGMMNSLVLLLGIFRRRRVIYEAMDTANAENGTVR